MNLESPKVSVNKTPEEVFNFLTQVENYDVLMPENKEKFEADGNSFLFALKGMPEVRLVLNHKTPNSNIQFGAASSKLSFTLEIVIAPLDSESEVQLLFQGDFNPMMSMMVKKPLSNFINILAENISEI